MPEITSQGQHLPHVITNYTTRPFIEELLSWERSKLNIILHNKMEEIRLTFGSFPQQ
jgi:hypothetical protein